MTITRRQLLKSGLSVSMLWLGVEASGLSGCHVFYGNEKPPTNTLAFLGVIEQDAQLQLCIFCPRQEMGQGAQTLIAMLVAEELDIPLNDIKVIFASNPDELGYTETVGSESARQLWLPLRTIGATARVLFLQAGAKKLNLPLGNCFTQNGFVVSKEGMRVSYVSLWSEVQKQTLPQSVSLKSQAEFKILGFSQPQIKLDQILAGTELFSIDFICDDMLYAMIERAPHPNAILKNQNILKDYEGQDIHSVYFEKFSSYDPILRDGVVIVADNTWAALKLRKKMRLEWQVEDFYFKNNEEQFSKMASSIKEAVLLHEEGALPDTVAEKTEIKRQYLFPYLPHLSMETPNCVVKIENERCKIWVGTQRPKKLREKVAEFLQSAPSNVVIHPLRMGGGFGRKAQVDYVLEGVLIAKKIKRPVKLIWTREDDIQFDFFRPANLQALRVTLQEDNALLSWEHICILPKGNQNKQKEIAFIDPALQDMKDGAMNVPLHAQHYRFLAKGVASDVRTGIWRSVNHSFYGHALNCFIDEIAFFSHQHPLEFRLDHRRKKSMKQLFKTAFNENEEDFTRSISVIKKLKEKTRLVEKEIQDQQQPFKKGIGFAVHHCFGCDVAMAITICVTDKKITLDQVYVVIDAGFIINPDNAQAQVEGAIYFALSAALFSEIMIENGRVLNRNFHDTPILRLHQAPKIQVEWLGLERAPQGLGEACVPVVSPALCNAIFSALGTRIYQLPLSRYFDF